MLLTLRGSGPAPSGYWRCYEGKCPAKRDPYSGRFTAKGTHYHPNNLPYLPAGSVWDNDHSHS